jgi:ribosome-associated toxin RatA of RatAB toxin-antitoxin module
VSTIEKSIDVDVPVRAAYNQWTQFAEFPRFMEGVERVEQINDTMTHWVTRIGGVTREFDAQIVEQQPDKVVHWRSVKGPRNEGEVRFEPLDEDHTRITLNMHYEPEGVLEKAGDALHIVERRAEADLKRFKEFIEERGVETGAWRGDVDEGRAKTPRESDRTGEDIPGVSAGAGRYGETGLGTGGATPGRAGAQPVADADVAGTERERSIPQDTGTGADAGTTGVQSPRTGSDMGGETAPETRSDVPPERPEDPDRPLR